MWKCKHCGEELDDTYDRCWKCGWGVEGQPPDTSKEQKQGVVSAKPSKPTFEFPKWLMIVIALGCVVAVATLKTNRDLADKEEASAPFAVDGTPFEVTETRLETLREGFAEAGVDYLTTGEGFYVSIIERRAGRKCLVKIEWLERQKPPKDPKIEALESALRQTRQMREANMMLYQAVLGDDLRSVSNLIEEARVKINGVPDFSPTRNRVTRTNNGNVIVAVEYPTPLHKAVSRTNLDIAAFLVAKGADVNARNEKGMTALHLAAKIGHTKIVEMLLANHADKEIKDATGKTALDYATEADHEDIVNHLTNSVAK